ncbi:uncharacterized protein LOC143017420 [Oratosquilla oratoria]|uniref:uncharacterized protein LOC143017420 n=1 Tax=Oratosquilla oratoria TaxID=337810 RepID=UPI003F75DE14
MEGRKNLLIKLHTCRIENDGDDDDDDDGDDDEDDSESDYGQESDHDGNGDDEDGDDDVNSASDKYVKHKRSDVYNLGGGEMQKPKVGSGRFDESVKNFTTLTVPGTNYSSSSVSSSSWAPEGSTGPSIERHSSLSGKMPSDTKIEPPRTIQPVHGHITESTVNLTTGDISWMDSKAEDQTIKIVTKAEKGEKGRSKVDNSKVEHMKQDRKCFESDGGLLATRGERKNRRCKRGKMSKRKELGNDGEKNGERTEEEGNVCKCEGVTNAKAERKRGTLEGRKGRKQSMRRKDREAIAMKERTNKESVENESDVNTTDMRGREKRNNKYNLSGNTTKEKATNNIKDFLRRSSEPSANESTGPGTNPDRTPEPARPDVSKASGEEKNAVGKGQTDPGSMENQPASRPVRVLVLGGHGVGKSAVTVRYLTKRFIGEYRSQVDVVYRHQVTLQDRTVQAEVVDVSTRPGDMTVPSLEICQCDCYLVVYSISDRPSFGLANQLLRAILTLRHPSSPPITLLGNKHDLEHCRQVTPEEGEKLALDLGCSFAEVSAAENSASITPILHDLVSRADDARCSVCPGVHYCHHFHCHSHYPFLRCWSSHVTNHSPSGVSPPSSNSSSGLLCHSGGGNTQGVPPQSSSCTSSSSGVLCHSGGGNPQGVSQPSSGSTSGSLCYSEMNPQRFSLSSTIFSSSMTLCRPGANAQGSSSSFSPTSSSSSGVLSPSNSSLSPCHSGSNPQRSPSYSSSSSSPCSSSSSSPPPLVSPSFPQVRGSLVTPPSPNFTAGCRKLTAAPGDPPRLCGVENSNGVACGPNPSGVYSGCVSAGRDGVHGRHSGGSGTNERGVLSDGEIHGANGGEDSTRLKDADTKDGSKSDDNYSNCNFYNKLHSPTRICTKKPGNDVRPGNDVTHKCSGSDCGVGCGIASPEPRQVLYSKDIPSIVRCDEFGKKESPSTRRVGEPSVSSEKESLEAEGSNKKEPAKAIVSRSLSSPVVDFDKCDSCENCKSALAEASTTSRGALSLHLPPPRPPVMAPPGHSPLSPTSSLMSSPLLQGHSFVHENRARDEEENSGSVEDYRGRRLQCPCVLRAGSFRSSGRVEVVTISKPKPVLTKTQSAAPDTPSSGTSSGKTELGSLSPTTRNKAKLKSHTFDFSRTKRLIQSESCYVLPRAGDNYSDFSFSKNDKNNRSSHSHLSTFALGSTTSSPKSSCGSDAGGVTGVEAPRTPEANGGCFTLDGGRGGGLPAAGRQRKFSVFGVGRALGNFLSRGSMPDLPRATASFCDKFGSLKRTLKKRSV